MNYPPVIREIVSKVPRYDYKETYSWSDMILRAPNDEFNHIIRQRAAQCISRDFTNKVAERMLIDRRETPDGYEVSFSSIALRYDELTNLLYTAYREGQTDGMRRDSNPNFLES